MSVVWEGDFGNREDVMNQVMDLSEVAVVTLSSFVLALLLTLLLMKLMFKAMQTLRMADVHELEHRKS
jgi:hypothetical protein